VEGVEWLTAVRHGESTANAVWARAVRDGLALRIPGRDATIGLSPYGREQAAAVGRWLAGCPDECLPQEVWCSPYLRARQTWAIAQAELQRAGRAAIDVRTDDRLRDRELGEWELLTPAAIAERFPEATGAGPFSRPPGGESFADMAERIHRLLGDIGLTMDVGPDDAGDVGMNVGMDMGAAPASASRRLLIVAHDAVVLLIRHLLDGGTPDDVERILEFGQVGTGSVSRWRRSGARMELVTFNATAHLAT
jgi:2,3-bisphosphoglycerate-dependent phosphoglycerate mutase